MVVKHTDGFSRCAECGHLEIVHDLGRCNAGELTNSPCSCVAFVLTSNQVRKTDKGE